MVMEIMQKEPDEENEILVSIYLFIKLAQLGL